MIGLQAVPFIPQDASTSALLLLIDKTTFSCAFRYDYDCVFHALVEAVDSAIGFTRRNWKPSCDMEVYRREMDALSKFTKISVFPQLKHLDFYKIPKTIRYRIIENLVSQRLKVANNHISQKCEMF